LECAALKPSSSESIFNVSTYQDWV